MCFTSTIGMFAINIDYEGEILDIYKLYREIRLFHKTVNCTEKLQISLDNEINIIPIIRGKGGILLKIPSIEEYLLSYGKKYFKLKVFLTLLPI